MKQEQVRTLLTDSGFLVDKTSRISCLHLPRTFMSVVGVRGRGSKSDPLHESSNHRAISTLFTFISVADTVADTPIIPCIMKLFHEEEFLIY